MMQLKFLFHFFFNSFREFCKNMSDVIDAKWQDCILPSLKKLSQLPVDVKSRYFVVSHHSYCDKIEKDSLWLFEQNTKHFRGWTKYFFLTN